MADKEQDFFYDSAGRKKDKENGRFVEKFDNSIGEQVMELSRKGYSLQAIAGHLGLSREVFYLWMRKYPEFKELCMIAKDARIFAWEKKMVDAESGPAVQAASLALRASGLHDWKDKKEMEVSVENKHTINLEQMSPDQIKQLMSIVQTQESLAIEDQSEDVEFEEMPE